MKLFYGLSLPAAMDAGSQDANLEANALFEKHTIEEIRALEKKTRLVDTSWLHLHNKYQTLTQGKMSNNLLHNEKHLHTEA